MLVDSHCHLDFPEFEDDFDAVLARAAEAGVSHMLTICTRVTTFDAILATAERAANLWCSVGIHPHNAASEPEVSAEHLVRMAENPKVVAFGETGLDFHYEHSPRNLQETYFRAHIEASRQAGLPLVVHTRDADADTMRILEDEYGKGPFGGVIHCFSAGRELAERTLAIGFYISFSGIVTFNKAEEIRAVAADVPIERILVETDAPYLAPVPKRGKRNEPAYTAFTAARVAEVKGVSPEALAERTTENFFRLFAKAEPEAGAAA